MGLALSWSVRGDGTFDLVAGDLKLENCYPAIDGMAVHPLSVKVTRDPGGGSVSYELASGILSLRLGRRDETLTLQALLSGVAIAPHRIQPLAGGQVSGADRLFRQGKGLGGPTGFVELEASSGVESVQSYTVSGLCTPEGHLLTIATYDHNHFLQRTVLFPPLAGLSPVTLDIEFVTEHVPIESQGLQLPELNFRLHSKPFDGLRATAVAIGEEMQTRIEQPTSYHWCSWYYLYHNLTEAILDEYLAGFHRLTPRVPLQTIQIDAGYFPATGDWLETTPYWPSGLEAAFTKIAAAGYRPGIWIAPFMVGNRSRLYAEHPDWVLQDLTGDPIAPWRTYNEPKPWGYRDEETYVLDTSHPEAMDYLRLVFRTFRGWGATFFKTDFMAWGLQDSTTLTM